MYEQHRRHNNPIYLNSFPIAFSLFLSCFLCKNFTSFCSPDRCFFKFMLSCSRCRHAFCPFPALLLLSCLLSCHSRRINNLFMRLAAPPLECVVRLSTRCCLPISYFSGIPREQCPAIRYYRNSILNRHAQQDVDYSNETCPNGENAAYE